MYNLITTHRAERNRKGRHVLRFSVRVIMRGNIRAQPMLAHLIRSIVDAETLLYASLIEYMPTFQNQNISSQIIQTYQTGPVMTTTVMVDRTSDFDAERRLSFSSFNARGSCAGRSPSRIDGSIASVDAET